MTKIQYKGKHFFIKYHPVEEEAGGRKADETVYKVVCDNRFSAKRLWMNAIEQHTFFKWVPFFWRRLSDWGRWLHCVVGIFNNKVPCC